MSVSSLHTIYAAVLNGTTVDGVVSNNINTGIGSIRQGADGSVYPTFTAAMGQAPTISLQTVDVKGVLDITGVIGAAIDASDAIFFLQQFTEGGTRAGVSSHVKMTVDEGMYIPRGISVSQGGVAQISMDTIVTYDGTLDPIVVATGQSLTGTPSVSSLWTVGKVDINGTDMTGIQSIDIDFGVNTISMGSDGDVSPTYVAINQVQPTITVRTTDGTAIDTIGAAGTSVSTTCTIWLRKLDEGGTRVADVTAEHISFVINEGRVEASTVASSHGGVTETEIVFLPTYDGSNIPLVLDTTAAIT